MPSGYPSEFPVKSPSNARASGTLELGYLFLQDSAAFNLSYMSLVFRMFDAPTFIDNLLGQGINMFIQLPSRSSLALICFFYLIFDHFLLLFRATTYLWF